MALVSTGCEGRVYPDMAGVTVILRERRFRNELQSLNQTAVNVFNVSKDASPQL